MGLSRIEPPGVPLNLNLQMMRFLQDLGRVRMMLAGKLADAAGTALTNFR